MPITDRAKQLIKKDSNLRAKLMLAGGKSEQSLARYLKNSEDDNLTMPKYTTVIAEHTGLKLDEIVEEVIA